MYCGIFAATIIPKITSMNLRNLFFDEYAAEGLPMRLVVTVILLSVIIGLSSKSVTLFINDANEKKLMGELDMIDKRASVIYTQGGARDVDDPADITGTLENIHVEIPDNAVFVVFGGMPDPGGNPYAAGNIYTDNVFYYVLADGRVKTKSSIARFTANNTGKPIVLFPGEYDLTMELIKNKNGTYIKIE